ncbi:MAG: hypothetical protein A3K19_05770 [Lentisphaerae bacterium RIFOXYB12_FULL_65_16]|nr:MAG: hypothetical protein A3K18_15385 [Lentisphaerae bacterium RIFOXYA12_64_32]OGV95080.1 MAG: hypothetical protein A3K19_05770 [Lentisphaerae bacterium RIFOXYB12_FULL_65_16]
MKTTTPRDRVLTAIAHREPDRVPYNLRLISDLLPVAQAQIGTTDYAEYYGHDVRYVGLKLPPKPEAVPPAEWAPLPTADIIAQAAEQTRKLHARDLAVCSSYFCGVYEQAKHWLGYEETMLGPYEDPAKFGAALDRIEAWKSALYGAYAAAGTDIVWMGDDLGTQRSLVMSPEMYREWYKPRHRRIAAHIRSIRPEVKVAFHCCGYVTSLIPDLIESGIDILEAVQAECMDLAGLKTEFGKDITFWGGVGAQSVLARTSPEQVTDGVCRTLEIMAPGGGYIAAPCHTLTEEVPWPSIAAFHDAVRQYGAYPAPGRR